MTDPDRTRLQRLFDGFGEAALEDPGMAREILAGAGLDADRLAEEGASFARRLYGAARLSAASVRRAEAHRTTTELRDRVAARIRAAGGDLRAELARLMSAGDAAQFQASFRKIEELGEEDALDMLIEAEILRLLDEMDPSGLEAGDDPERNE